MDQMSQAVGTSTLGMICKQQRKALRTPSAVQNICRSDRMMKQMSSTICHRNSLKVLERHHPALILDLGHLPDYRLSERLSRSRNLMDVGLVKLFKVKIQKGVRSLNFWNIIIVVQGSLLPSSILR